MTARDDVQASTVRVVSLFDYLEAKGHRLDAELRAEGRSAARAELLLEEVRRYRAATRRRQRRRDRGLLPPWEGLH